MKQLVLILLSLMLCGYSFQKWGFFGHRLINRQAIFSLPPEMIGFYKSQINVITEKAVNPDKRRYAVEDEAARHYIDIDHYGDSAVYNMPKYWLDAVDQYSEDTLEAYGIVPWHITIMKYQLTEAFKKHDFEKILRLSAEIGHYIADANVPLHTTENYNGQLTGQYGIHGFWESRLPELFSQHYDLLVGQAEYISSPQDLAWAAIINAHMALDSVLQFERDLSFRIPSDKKYSYEERGASFVRVYSKDFSLKYHRKLNGMVERRMKAAIKMIADFWYTCWVDAGQPDLLINPLEDSLLNKLSKDKNEWLKKKFKRRTHESN